MSDRIRTDVVRPPGGVPDSEKDARIEQLLLSGLDEYFAGNFDQAINIWTRVAFLERGHNRARAYIERARRALAERHRESDELLHRGIAAFNEGQADTARELITRAVEQGGPQDVALVLLERLNRLSGPASGPAATTRTVPTAVEQHGDLVPPAAEPPTRQGWAGRSAVPVLLLAALVAAVVGATLAPGWFAEPGGGPQARAAALPPDPLPIPTSSERVLARARALRSAGHLLEAVRTLETIDVADPVRPDADRLRADLQRQLMAAAPVEATR
jgi:hypothetical protein